MIKSTRHTPPELMYTTVARVQVFHLWICMIATLFFSEISSPNNESPTTDTAHETTSNLVVIG